MPAKENRRESRIKTGQQKNDADFYSRVLDEAEQIDFELACGVEGIDDEIALLRVKIKSILQNDPENLRLIMQATNSLERLVRTRYKITKEQRKGLREAITNVIKDIAVPLGVAVLRD